VRGLRDWSGRVDPRIIDLGLALAVLAAVEVTCWVSSGVSESDRIVTAIAAVAFAAPIAVRRQWPAEALVICAAVATVSTQFGGQLLSNDNAYVIPVLVLGYSAGAGLEGRRSVMALILAPGPDGTAGGAGSIVWALFYATMLLVPTWLIGRYVYRYSHRTSAFDALAAQAAAAKDEQQAAAIAAERARIGSELQDIIAHSISAMVIQAGSARLMLRADPGRARDSILNVEETGRQALSDLRRLLGMLRRDADPRALSPQPGLGQLNALINSLQHAGLACERHTIGEETDLTPGTDLVAYRVVETALRAAADGHARYSVVTVRYEPRDLELEIRCDRPFPDLDTTFAPLVERVALYNGELRAEPSPDGFVVQARLPFEAGVPA
jgi:signal transduction histidine kinase